MAGYLELRGLYFTRQKNIHQKYVHSFADIETITRFALLEFKHGEPERGKTLLDNVLISYPKRTDILSMYVDVLAKNEDVAAARYNFYHCLLVILQSWSPVWPVFCRNMQWLVS